jgi:TRAP-type mannitol/chloroaromatic compound transport system permease large subunit
MIIGPVIGLGLLVMKGVASKGLTLGDMSHAAFLFILFEGLLLWFMIIFPGIVLGLLGLIYKA